jgi:hypothetical protein
MKVGLGTPGEMLDFPCSDCGSRRYNPPGSTKATPMTNAQEKHVNRIAELKGFRLEKGGHGKGHGRFYVMDIAEGGRMRSGVPDHDPSCASETTSLTPRRPRRASLRRNAVQNVSASEGPMSIPSISRRPSLLTPTATITATDTMRPFWRTFT